MRIALWWHLTLTCRGLTYYLMMMTQFQYSSINRTFWIISVMLVYLQSLWPSLYDSITDHLWLWCLTCIGTGMQFWLWPSYDVITERTFAFGKHFYFMFDSGVWCVWARDYMLEYLNLSILTLAHHIIQLQQEQMQSEIIFN